MEKLKQIEPARKVIQEGVASPVNISNTLIEEARTFETDSLQKQEYMAARLMILEFHESLLQVKPVEELAEIETELALETGGFKSDGRTISAQGGACKISLHVGQDVPKSSDQDFLQRFSQLSKRLNQQLADFQETSKQVINVNNRIGDTASTLTTGIGTIEDECRSLKLDPELDP